MSEDEKAKLQRNLRHAVVQSWMISNLAVAVLVAAIPLCNPKSPGVVERPADGARRPAPAPQRPGVVEQAEVEASPPSRHSTPRLRHPSPRPSS